MKSLSRVQLLATPWTAAYQAPPSMGFSRQEYWSRVPLPSPYYLAIPTFGYISKINEIKILRRYLYTHVHSSIFYNIQNVEAIQASTVGRMVNKMWYTHTMGYWSALNKKGRKFWHTLQSGWTLKTLCYVKCVSHKKTNTILFRLYEISRVVKFIEIQSRMVVSRAWRNGAMESCYLMGREF